MTLNTRCKLANVTMGLGLLGVPVCAAWLAELGFDKLARVSLPGGALVLVCLLILRGLK